MEVVQVALEQIEGSVYQPRRREDHEIDRLVKSIVVNGLRFPVLL